MRGTLSDHCGVLVISGGMAAAWAAIAAAKAGASTTLVDKGYVGTSGVTATGGPSHWWVPLTRQSAALRSNRSSRPDSASAILNGWTA